MNRATETTALIIAIALFFATSCSRKDHELSAQATALLALTENTNESLAYLYLLGIEAPGGVDPIDVGRHTLEGSGKYSVDAADAEKNDGDSSYHPSGPLFCNIFKEGCLTELFTAEINIEKIRLENSTLISRSNTFYSFDEFRTLSKPSLHDEVVPWYSSITAFERIEVLGAISNYHDGRIEPAIDSLFVQVDRLRRAIELQDNLLGKLVFLTKLSEVIDVTSIILSKSPETAVSVIPRLSLKEKNFRQIAAREFLRSYTIIQSLIAAPRHTGDVIVQWFVRLIFKPNMTSNAVVPVYRQMEKLALLSHAEFSRALQSKSRVTTDTPFFSNALGNFLLDKELNIDKHVARFHDVDAKLALFNHHFYLKDEFGTFKNPYYPAERSVVTEDRVCFRGPVEEVQTQCLRTQINPRPSI